MEEESFASFLDGCVERTPRASAMSVGYSVSPLPPGRLSKVVAKSYLNVCTAMGAFEHGGKTKPSDMQRSIVDGLRQRVECWNTNMQLCGVT